MENQTVAPNPMNLIGQQLSDHARIEQLEKQVEDLRRAVYGDLHADVPAVRTLIKHTQAGQAETNRRLDKLQTTNYLSIAVLVTHIIITALITLN